MTSPTISEAQPLAPTPSESKHTLCISQHDLNGNERPTLGEVSPSWLMRVGVAVGLLTVPVVYLVLIELVAHLYGKKQSSFGDNILEVLQLASTLWPISFAAVIGPFLRTLALYCAERGATLGSLEFLLTSQTTVAAVKNLFAFRHIHIWTIGVIAIWCFSPLGGQAAVRSLYLQSPTHNETIDATHYFSQVPLRTLCHNINQSDFYQYYGCGSAFAQHTSLPGLLPAFRRAVNAAFARPDVLVSHPNVSADDYKTVIQQLGGVSPAARLGKQDIWRNVRVPFMELLPEYDHRVPESWIQIPSEIVVPYSSFIGVPVRRGSHPEAAGNSSMVLHTRYQTLSCDDAFNGTSWLKLKDDESLVFYHNTNFTDSSPLEQQKLKYGLDTKPSLWMDLVLNNATDSHFNNKTNLTFESPLQLIVGGDCGNGQMIRVCNITTSYVDVEVGCKRLSSKDDLNCQADRIRRSPHPVYSIYLSDLSYSPVSERLVYEMPFTTAPYQPNRPSLLERYIRQPSSTFSTADVREGVAFPACYSNLSSALFEARFATALNTFLMASYDSTILTGAESGFKDGIDEYGNPTNESTYGNDMWQNTTATWTEFTESIYVIDVAWFCTFIISTIILLGCAIANTVIRELILAPDFLDSVDGLTRDSPFVKIPRESWVTGSGVSSKDRLRATNKIRVQIRDVDPDADVGRIVLTTDTTEKRLDWHRAYV
ncbi:hypothetical protein FSST1_012320 [Fusarium sambucinum]